MSEALFVSNALLWVAVVALALVVFALARQIGVLHERIAPAGALVLRGGPAVGEPAPILEVEDLTGRRLRVGGARDDGASTLLLFVSPTCPVCKTLLPVVRRIAREEAGALAVVLASDGELEAQRRFAREQELLAFPYVVSTALGLAWQVGRLPHAALIDEAGVVRAKGLVNSREHLESLFEARERGVASIQELLAGASERSLAQGGSR
jgi:methylamine dehydrogenase accessory protein MauD